MKTSVGSFAAANGGGALLPQAARNKLKAVKKRSSFRTFLIR
jgi:hypothetical protein